MEYLTPEEHLQGTIEQILDAEVSTEEVDIVLFDRNEIESILDPLPLEVSE